jgi:GR25 family glycosyltransferase involved in LPS biosynthesis
MKANKSTPFDFFDEIYCISCKTRPKKRERAARQFKQIGILDRVSFFDAIMVDPYWVGCTEAHRACIRKAKSNGANNVLIFEEDVFFLHKDLSSLSSALETLGEFDWEVFSLGLSVHKVKSHISENLCLVMGSLAHACALHKRCWDEVLNYPDTEECYDHGGDVGDKANSNVRNKGHIDAFMTHRFEKFMIKPIMAVQPDKASSTLKKYYDFVL